MTCDRHDIPNATCIACFAARQNRVKAEGARLRKLNRAGAILADIANGDPHLTDQERFDLFAAIRRIDYVTTPSIKRSAADPTLLETKGA